ncbi:UDP-N-acetylmuramoyl-L-alanyl-D-glutamate--2,6-diaminopimelate ligase [Leptospira sp. GIMC2001]|uniref:UDP-N-acetylmuramoyl-L-alanyl-D-glutamate--2, 6-diaminopimelate ligase n=1 Tax=Leptospira sp. GIMC2001 TaxID=1513297 RepID=UPI00234949E7|nr:UDP-N-acetylmuramoyl-L-alanyl-D-glutamate--2,6-diaminopimelate ligase [Leptospira sp. GIMC2001]WCL47982.1 UDP-N-acetylmuramoyl-L-alanyl-D-glutamate--2,6-diaminopimelate ligase [Leptospira sp. GIMC2001]
MQISSLLNNFPTLRLAKGSKDSDIGYIWTDSRLIEKKDIFLIDDNNCKIEHFQNAIDNGSTTCIAYKGSKFLDEAINYFPTVIESEELILSIHGDIASFLLGHPSKNLKIFAVTGTNGKTSVTHILYHFSMTLGIKSGVIGTVNARFGTETIDTGYTTPEPSLLQKILRAMVDDEIEFVFMEASSHGLKLGRMNGVEIDVAIFTNLTKDHLDFHKTMDDYLLSKFQLFVLLEKSSKKDKYGIVYKDASGGSEIAKLLADRSMKTPISYIGKGEEFQFMNTTLGIKGSDFLFCHSIPESTFQRTLRIKTNLLGGFNVINLSIAIATWMSTDIAPEKLSFLCEYVPRIPGRFDIYHSSTGDKLAVVDYAHTPDAILNILQSCREMKPTYLICLFGCGGDRDRTKRTEMAKIAEDNSDLVIITSDNPRTESPSLILDEIQSGFSKDFTSFQRIEDRRDAIRYGIEQLPAGGILAVCGKGHENYQIIGKEKLYFHDGEEVEFAFKNFDPDRM